MERLLSHIDAAQSIAVRENVGGDEPSGAATTRAGLRFGDALRQGRVFLVLRDRAGSLGRGARLGELLWVAGGDQAGPADL
jgi:hypothetical protein